MDMVYIVIAILSPLLPLFIIYKSYKNEKRVQLIGSVLLLNLFTDSVTFVFAIKGIETNLIFQGYTLIFGVLVFLMYLIEVNNQRLRRLFYWCLGGFVVMYILIITSVIELDAYSLLSIFLILVSIIYMWWIFYELEIENLTKHYFFWINTAFFFYLSSTFIFLIFINFVLIKSNWTGVYLWKIQNIAAIIFNLIIAKGIWTLKKA